MKTSPALTKDMLSTIRWTENEEDNEEDKFGFELKLGRELGSKPT